MNILKEATEAKKKDAAKKNYSTIWKPIIPADFSSVLLPLLHIVLDITKKMWDCLIAT